MSVKLYVALGVALTAVGALVLWVTCVECRAFAELLWISTMAFIVPSYVTDWREKHEQ